MGKRARKIEARNAAKLTQMTEDAVRRAVLGDERKKPKEPSREEKSRVRDPSVDSFP